MEKHKEVIERILELLETIATGIVHIQKQLSEIRYEEAFSLLQDTVLGIVSIEDALVPIMPKFRGNNIENLADILRNNLSKAVSSYEQAQEINLEKQLEKDILPAFKEWKAEVERMLKPYVVS